MFLFNATWIRFNRITIATWLSVLTISFQWCISIDPAWGARLQYEDQKIELTDQFSAFPIAIDGDVALIGVFTLGSPESQSVYVFRKDGIKWVQGQKLEPWGENITYYFKQFVLGLMYRSLAVDGNVAMVPAYSGEIESILPGQVSKTPGEIYVFHWNGTEWVKDQILTFQDNNRQFDGPVAVRGDLAVLGGWKADGEESIRAAYVFRKVGGTWTEEQMLFPSDGDLRGFFGHDVAISDDGDMVVIGSGYRSPYSSPDSAVYVFRRQGETWVEIQKVTTSYNKPVGHSVALSGDWLFAGNPGGPAEENNGGTVSVFRWNGSAWEQRQKLLASDTFSKNNFGTALDVSGDLAVISADVDIEGGTPIEGYNGQAYVFRLNGDVWREEKKLVTRQALAQNDNSVQSFGYTAVVDNDTVLVSAITASSQGDVYSYAISSGAGCGCSSEE